MTWQGRLREVQYTSPSGAVFTWAYEAVSRNLDKQGGEFTFPDTVGTYIQDLGSTGRRYPFTCFFNGDNHDTEADAFFEALAETGVGVLDHPRYGRKNVVPFGSIDQRDDLKTQANQTAISVTFFDTIDLIFPTGTISPSATVLSAVNSFNSTVSAQFGDSIDVDSAIEQVSFRDRMELATNRIGSLLEPVYDQTDSVRREFEAVSDSINNSLTVLVGEPLAYATQTLELLQLPSRAGDTIRARLDGYTNLVNQIIGNESNVENPSNDSTPANNFNVNDLTVVGSSTGYGLSAINGEFANKNQAIEAAETLLNDYDAVAIWRDTNYQNLEIVDTGETFDSYSQVVFATAGYLVAISFDLPQEKTIILERARTLIDLTAELFPSLSSYDELEDKVTELININEIVGTDLLELPEGKRIIYFA